MPMSVWSYNDEITDKEVLKYIYNIESCLFCGQSDWEVVDFYEDLSYGEKEGRNYSNGECICYNCGWWIKTSNTLIIADGKKKYVNGCTAGSLKKLNLLDINTPLSEINSYLVAKYEDRHKLSWQLFEDIVGHVFKNLGYTTIVTSRSNDGGIDAILLSSNNEQIGVQVKKYKNNIKAEQIRELTGAMVIGGITKGIFVTTSDFQHSAISSAEISTIRGYPIELLNAKRFYDALKLTNTLSWSGLKESKIKVIGIKSV